MNIQTVVAVAISQTKTHSRAVRHCMDRRSMVKSLEALADKANTHEEYGVPAGDRIYIALYERASIHCSRFIEKWPCDIQDLHTEIPALERLRRLSAQTTR